MKHVLTILLLLLSCALLAEYKVNPDENTLWSEDGSNISGWRDGLLMTANPEGGFFMQPGTANDGGRYIKKSPEYPWFVTEITSIDFLGEYRDLTIPNLFGMIGDPKTGLFVVRQNIPNNADFLRIDIHGMKLGVKYMKQVRIPDNYIDATINGDDIDIKVTLKDAAEDVCLRFYSSYTMPLLTFNDEDKLQLYPEDEENPVVWKGTLKNYRQNGKINGYFLVKATVLGGTLKVPLWGTVCNPF